LNAEQNILELIFQICKKINRIREQGCAVDDKEYYDNARCLAAPIRGTDGDVIKAIGITATTMIFPSERIPEIAEKVLRIALDISRQMGSI